MVGTERAVNGNLVLVLGIVSIFFFPLILGPIAWYMGNNALAVLNQGGGDPSQRSSVTTGRICGMIGTGLGIFWLLWFVFFGGLMVLGALAGS
jgi:hypothetical protein